MPEFRLLDDPEKLPAGAWDALLAAADQPTPFMRARFLQALQAAAHAGTGWEPCFATLWNGDELVAGCPLYRKWHSWGEYVFDQAWARAYASEGLAYYPKALVAVPFTPVPGSRLLARDAGARLQLAQALQCWTRDQGLSGLHVLFGSPADAEALASLGFAQRLQPQFHWENLAGWTSFADFLASLRRDKRKKIQQERRRVADAGATVQVIEGADITSADWDFFYRCYARTYALRGNPPYLPKDFFASALDAGDQWVLLLAEREGRRVAAALLAVDVARQVVYGRHWGAVEDVDCLHFELCYYAPLAWCLAQGIRRFEGGAQGEHKMARGLLPVPTQSHHWLARPDFQDAVRRFTLAEQAAVVDYEAELAARSPFKLPR